jgi:hypothetical protein
VRYLLPALRASERGEAFAFVAVAATSLLGAALGARLVRRPVGQLNPEEKAVTPGP